VNRVPCMLPALASTYGMHELVVSDYPLQGSVAFNTRCVMHEANVAVLGTCMLPHLQETNPCCSKLNKLSTRVMLCTVADTALHSLLLPAAPACCSACSSITAAVPATSSLCKLCKLTHELQKALHSTGFAGSHVVAQSASSVYRQVLLKKLPSNNPNRMCIQPV
jgi:hypothetical protein